MSKTITRKYLKRVANRDINISKYSVSSSGGNSSGGNSSSGGTGGGGGVSQYWVETNFVSRADYDAKVAELEQRIQDLEDRVTALENASTS
jgi:hypothetical protein